MDGGIDLATARGFAIALLIGALVGIEREKHKAAEKISGTPGLRTFMLLGECGAVGAYLAGALGSPWILAAATVAASALLAAEAFRGEPHRTAPGMTTESAALAVFLLGALAVAGSAALAAALGIATSALLAYKQPLHRVVVTGIGTEDFFAALRLLIATFIVLPLLPDRPVDPWGALNPAKLWLLVIVISALSFAGYLATRRLGPGRGAAVTGAAGGLVSSTAVTLSFARRSREAAGCCEAEALACGTVLAWAVMFPRVVVIVLLVNPVLARPLLLPFAAMGAAAAAVAWRLYRRTAGESAGEVPLRSPFSIKEAVKFALLFACVLLVVAVVGRHFPGRGELVVAAIAGLTDVDAITLSMADQARRGSAPATAVAAITIASLSNTVVKALLAAFLGSPVLGRRVGAAAAVVLAAGAAALVLVR